MIAFKYTKCRGAEYLSHLDLLRHIDRTLKRAGIKIEYSQGFNKHPRIFLNNPLGLGISSMAEYGTIDTQFEGDFKALFNAHSPDGIKCLNSQYMATNPNYANSIDKCRYQLFGQYDKGIAEDILEKESIEIDDLRGRKVDIRPRIYAIEWAQDSLSCILGCGENNLRPDLFAQFLLNTYACRTSGILKTASFGEFVF